MPTIEPDTPDTPEMAVIHLTVRVRRAQVEYFKSRNYASLCRARDLERELDQDLREMLGAAGEVRQPGAIR